MLGNDSWLIYILNDIAIINMPTQALNKATSMYISEEIMFRSESMHEELPQLLPELIEMCLIEYSFPMNIIFIIYLTGNVI